MGFPFTLARGRPVLAKRVPLSQQESALVWVITANLIFLPWAFGGMHPWSQLTSLALSLGALGVAVLRRPNLPEANQPRRRLLKFPAFWAGAALAIYILVQALNPSWRFMTDSRSWWLVPLPYIHGLPSGVDGPFSRSNPWRALVIIGSIWALGCAAWSGFLTRKSIRVMLSALVLAGAALAFEGLIQQQTGTERIFWVYGVPKEATFSASFIYRNHAGAYFDLMAALATGLASWHWQRSQRRLESPGAAIGFGFAAALIVTEVIFSGSRMAIVLLVAFALLAALASAARLSWEQSSHRRRQARLLAGLSLASVAAMGLVSFEATAVWGRIAALASSPSATLRSRTLARQAALEMFKDRWILGWGAGCFRYGFPLYAQHFPEIYDSAHNGRMYWEHAHDDLLEIPLELGIVGSIPIAAALGFFAWRLFRTRFWRSPLPLCLAGGCALTLAHAWVDFVFQCPAVLATWTILLISAVRWAELESSVERRRAGP
jgi:hypothetical protein